MYCSFKLLHASSYFFCQYCSLCLRCSSKLLHASSYFFCQYCSLCLHFSSKVLYCFNLAQTDMKLTGLFQARALLHDISIRNTYFKQRIGVCVIVENCSISTWRSLPNFSLLFRQPSSVIVEFPPPHFRAEKEQTWAAR